MGLSADFNVGMQSLLAATEAMDVTTGNISNMSTPGYARRRVVLEEGAPTGPDGSITGVDVKGIQSLRDSVLELTINANTAQQNFNSSLSSSLSAVQVLFSDTTPGSIGSSMDAFFGALQRLSTSPADATLRSNVLAAAGSVASAFRTAASSINQAQRQADQSVMGSAGEINSLLQQIAAINSQLHSAQIQGQSDNASQDQLANLLTQLAAQIDYKTVNSSDGLTLTTADGTPLVVGNKAYALTTAMNSDGFQDVYAGDVDITDSIQGGNLGGFLQARDQTLAGMRSALDQFAFQFAQAVNSVQTAGSDLNGDPGQAFFAPPDTITGSAPGAASRIAVAITSGSQIAAAASGGAYGDSSNLLQMIGLQGQPVINGSTPTDAFAHLTYVVGNAISEANINAEAAGNILTQLQNQKGAVEGVSLDEEAANLVLYQRAYQAAAKVISVIDTLMASALEMGAR